LIFQWLLSDPLAVGRGLSDAWNATIRAKKRAVKNFIERLDTPDDESVTDDEGILGRSEQERSDCFRRAEAVALAVAFAPVLNQTTTL
jgi:hypothetical protein